MSLTSRFADKAAPALDQLAGNLQTRTVLLVLAGVLVGLVAGVIIARAITPGAPTGI